ncbi:MAG: hypothetical protein ACI8W3_002446, partial [Myxococcota bacterium]
PLHKHCEPNRKARKENISLPVSGRADHDS